MWISTNQDWRPKRRTFTQFSPVVMRTSVSKELPYDLKLAWSFPYGPNRVSPKNSMNSMAKRHITIMKIAETFKMDGKEARTAWNKVCSEEKPCPNLIDTNTSKYCSKRSVQSFGCDQYWNISCISHIWELTFSRAKRRIHIVIVQITITQSYLFHLFWIHYSCSVNNTGHNSYTCFQHTCLAPAQAYHLD